jgi:hypothetical protein
MATYEINTYEFKPGTEEADSYIVTIDGRDGPLLETFAEAQAWVEAAKAAHAEACRIHQKDHGDTDASMRPADPKPTIKPNHGMTHHKDGTVSFFNTMTGQWERGNVNAYLKAKHKIAREAEASREADIAVMASERDNGDRFY